MKDGKIQQIGPPEEFIASPQIYSLPILWDFVIYGRRIKEISSENEVVINVGLN